MATKQKTILVVDDEPFFREEVVAFLNGPTFAARGWKVEAAVGGEEALARLERVPCCDVMLLDINMPGLDGMEVLRQMHERYLLEQAPLILVSEVDPVRAMQDYIYVDPDYIAGITGAAVNFYYYRIDLDRKAELLGQ